MAWDGPYPELAQGVDVLGLEKGVIVTVHEALPVHHGSIVYQDGDVAHLRAGGAAGPLGQRDLPPPHSPCTPGQPHRLSRHQPGFLLRSCLPPQVNPRIRKTLWQEQVYDK